MYRFLYFLFIIITPLVFGWWLFIPMTILFIYLAKLPIEVIIAGVMLDMVYYFGDGFIYEHLLTIFSVFVIILAFFLNKVVSWRKVI